MDRDFRGVYDPKNKVNHEVMLTLAGGAAAVNQGVQGAIGAFTGMASDPSKAGDYINAYDDEERQAMLESNMNAGYVVGFTEGGEFGKHT
jgi:hypothetical protein